MPPQPLKAMRLSNSFLARNMHNPKIMHIPKIELKALTICRGLLHLSLSGVGDHHISRRLNLSWVGL